MIAEFHDFKKRQVRVWFLPNFYEDGEIVDASTLYVTLNSNAKGNILIPHTAVMFVQCLV